MSDDDYESDFDLDVKDQGKKKSDEKKKSAKKEDSDDDWDMGDDYGEKKEED